MSEFPVLRYFEDSHPRADSPYKLYSISFHEPGMRSNPLHTLLNLSLFISKGL